MIIVRCGGGSGGDGGILPAPRMQIETTRGTWRGAGNCDLWVAAG